MCRLCQQVSPTGVSLAARHGEEVLQICGCFKGGLDLGLQFIILNLMATGRPL